jgi:hypothetical protein
MLKSKFTASLAVVGLAFARYPVAHAASKMVGGAAMVDSKTIVRMRRSRLITPPWSPPSRLPAWSIR